MTFLIASGLCLIGRKSVSVEKKYVFPIMIGSFCDVFGITLLYFSATFMPVGNIEAFYIGVFLSFSTTIDVIKQKTGLKGVIASGFALTGLLFLTQPWHSLVEKREIEAVPCKYWEDILYSSTPYLNTSLIRHTNQTIQTEELGYFIIINDEKRHIPLNPSYLGLIILVFAAIAGIVKGYTVKNIRRDIQTETLAFWQGAIGFVFACIFVIVWSIATGVKIISYPSGSICLTLVVLYSICNGILQILWIYSVGNFNISKIGIANCFIIVLMFLCQRTLLQSFHPGAANWSETLGIVTIIFSLLLVVFFELVLSSKK